MPIKFLFQLLKRRLFLNRSKLPFKLVVAVTYACNSRCRNCHIWKIYQDRPALQKAEMDLGDFKKLFYEVKDDLLFLELTGGEPFTRGDISEILRSVGKILSPYTYLGITTNGFMSEKIVDTMKQVLPEIKQPFVMAVSLDGLPDTHGRVRGIDGAFNKAIKTFLDLKKLQAIYPNFISHLSYTIFPENAGKLEEFLTYIDKYYAIKPNEVSISYCQESSLYHLTEKIKTNNNYREKVLADVDYFYRVAKRERLRSFFLRAKNSFKMFYLRKIPQFIDNPKNMIIPCTALRASAYIDAYGAVYPCIEWNKKLGSLRENSLREIWSSVTTKKTRQSICKKKCPNCWTVCEAQPSYLMRWPWL
ncbi:MAG TPA: radical SAM protein [Patescibacteria group bacterium]|nr:radical SAM protein [Patescibacteria group bacterium]